MTDALDTGGPQGPPPTSPSEKSGSGGAGVDLDRLAEWAQDTFLGAFGGDVLALVERVKALEAVAEAARNAVILEQDPSKTLEQNAEIHRRAEALRAALAAAGGGPDER